jgi:hypothetical protein
MYNFTENAIRGVRRRTVKPPPEEYGQPGTTPIPPSAGMRPSLAQAARRAAPREAVESPAGALAPPEETPGTAPKKKPGYSFWSAESRRAHPIVTGLLAYSLYGDRWPEAIQGIEERERRRKREDEEYEWRKQYRDRMLQGQQPDQGEGRYVRDPVTGMPVWRPAKPKPQMQPGPPEGIKAPGPDWVWKPAPNEAGGAWVRIPQQKQAPTPSQTPPAGMERPPGPGWIWVPKPNAAGGDWEHDPTYQKPKGAREPHEIERDAESLRREMVRLKKDLFEVEQAIASLSGPDDGAERQQYEALAKEYRQRIAQLEEQDEDLAGEAAGLPAGPLSREEYDTLKPQEKAEYRRQFRVPRI